MNHRIYSGLDRLPDGLASDNVTPGCLVLEGGALRGTYSVGVMDALMKADVNLECTVGVSAGALNGISYVSGQIGRSARSPLRYRHDPRYFGVGAFLRNRTPFGFDFMFGELSEKLDPLDLKRFSGRSDALWPLPPTVSPESRNILKKACATTSCWPPAPRPPCHTFPGWCA